MSFDLQRHRPSASPRRHARWALVLSLAFTVPTLAHAQPAGSPTGTSDRADTLYKQGNAAFKKGDLESARTAYREAYGLRQSFDIAGNLGAVEFQIGAYRDAAEHLSASLRVAPVNGSAEAKAKTAGLLRDAKAKIATLVVTTSEPGAELVVDGQSIGRSPFLDEIFVEPGHRVLTASLAGKTAKLELDLAAGSRHDVALELREATAPPGPTPPAASKEPTTRPPEEQREGPPLWPGFVIGGVGLAVLGAGVGVFAAGSGASSSADEAFAPVAAGGGSCEPARGPGSERCAGIQDDVDSAQTMVPLGGVMMGVGGAAVVGGVVYLIWAASNDGAAAETGFTPWVAPAAAGGSFSAHF